MTKRLVEEMKNKEKFAKEIVEIACACAIAAVDKNTGKPKNCSALDCDKCLFSKGKIGCDSRKKLREWAESEYIEKPVISKKDRAFLEYLRDNFKTIARDENGTICVFTGISKKSEVRSAFVYDGFYRNISNLFYVDLPMVKWEDDEPWLIEDLKKLEVVEDYE